MSYLTVLVGSLVPLRMSLLDHTDENAYEWIPLLLGFELGYRHGKQLWDYGQPADLRSFLGFS